MTLIYQHNIFCSFFSALWATFSKLALGHSARFSIYSIFLQNNVLSGNYAIWMCKHLVHSLCFAHKRSDGRCLRTAARTDRGGAVQHCNISLHDWADKERNSTNRNLGCISNQSPVQHITNYPGNKIFSGLFRCRKSSAVWRKKSQKKEWLLSVFSAWNCKTSISLVFVLLK